MDIRRLEATHPDFPDSLRHIPQPPAAIFVRGNLAPLLELPALAVVGTRRPTPYGRAVTTQLAGQSAGRGIAIMSGLALGIDALAHRAALDANGYTVAVLGSGLDIITPAFHYRLGQEILERGGALISEYPPSTPAHKSHFVERNRLVAGLSQAVLITEAAARSGTRHTATFALDQGKPVLAVPGPITSAQSEGPHTLIKSGATPVTQFNDILLALNLEIQEPITVRRGSNPAEDRLLKLLHQGVTVSGELLQASQLPVADFNHTLTSLELGGYIYALGGGHWALRPP